MTELKAHRILGLNEECARVDNNYYLKSEADKVIAELEKKLDLYKRGWEENDKINANLYSQIRHHKYKLRLAMAQEWRNYAVFCGMQSSCHNHRGFGKTAEKYSWKESHAWKCVHRYKELAEKFKELKNAED